LSANVIARNDLGVSLNTSNATGYNFKILDFAQVSDIHIADDKNPLRFENLKLFDQVPPNLEYLDNFIQTITRDQDTFSGRRWNATIKSINNKNSQDPIDFVICTGDHTDTDIEKELSWFIKIADGYKSDTYKIAVKEGSIKDVDPVGFDLLWYTTLGNHDVEYEGTTNNEGGNKGTNPYFGADAEDLCNQNEAIDKYKTSITSPWWHGFDLQGYYSFDPNPYIHCIVLNTANYNAEDGTHGIFRKASVYNLDG